MTEDQLFRLFSELNQEINQRALSVGDSAKTWLQSWAASKNTLIAERSGRRYKSAVDRFLKHLGESRASAPMKSLDAGELAGFRDERVKVVAASSVNVELKILKSAFTEAFVQGVILHDIGKRVRLLRKSKRNADVGDDGASEADLARRAFTVEELNALLAVAGDDRAEWKGMILVGLYSGQRLSDIARMRWKDISADGWWRFSSGKTSYQVNTFLPAHVFAMLKKGKKVAGAVHVFPKAFAAGSKRVGTLSNQFNRLMSDAGLIPKRAHRTVGVEGGRAGRRTVSPISFHSLRHTCTSWLKTHGASEVVAMSLVGHESKSVSRSYTHLPDSALRKAIAKMPVIGA